ncbi:MAG: DUF3052 family protein [Actinomycetota bacterium]
MAGYSGTPLPKKLGIKEGSAVAWVDAPDGFGALLDPLPPEVTVKQQARPPLDVVVAFFTEAGALAKQLPALTKAIFPAGGLWIAWPKRSSGVPTDITEDVIRDIALPTGLVDNKVCAIDETWSGLRLVVRKERRATR